MKKKQKQKHTHTKPKNQQQRQKQNPQTKIKTKLKTKTNKNQKNQKPKHQNSNSNHTKTAQLGQDNNVLEHRVLEHRGWGCCILCGLVHLPRTAALPHLLARDARRGQLGTTCKCAPKTASPVNEEVCTSQKLCAETFPGDSSHLHGRVLPGQTQMPPKLPTAS